MHLKGVHFQTDECHFVIHPMINFNECLCGLNNNIKTLQSATKYHYTVSFETSVTNVNMMLQILPLFIIIISLAVIFQ